MIILYNYYFCRERNKNINRVIIILVDKEIDKVIEKLLDKVRNYYFS